MAKESKILPTPEQIAKYGPDVVISVSFLSYTHISQLLFNVCQSNKQRTGLPKRRKATRACNHCQRTHLTCDNDRPCQRCIARGLAATCRDGSRKKAKYLADVPEAVAQSSDAELYDPRFQKRESVEVHSQSLQQISTPDSNQMIGVSPLQPGNDISSSAMSIDEGSSAPLSDFSFADISSQHEQQHSPEHQNQHQQGQHHHHHQMNPPSSIVSFDSSPLTLQQLNSTVSQPKRRNKSFQSSMVNLEYSIISNILNGTVNTSDTTNTTTSNNTGSNTGNSTILTQDFQPISPSFSEDSATSNSVVSNSQMLTPNYLNQFPLGDDPLHTNLSDILASVDLTDPSASSHDNWHINDELKPRPISFTIVDPQHKSANNNANMTKPPGYEDPFTKSTYEYARQQQQQSLYHQPFQSVFPKPKKPSDIYRNVKQPFPYTPGFHMLIKYLKERFNKTQLLRVAKCMAKYRPSFIAITSSLMEDDLIFMEQSFQRTLMEYEKYISYSGTPTVVWRRTAQIAAVGQEFCILTGWSKSQLVDQNRFIIELMDDDSVVEYFEMFSNISFGDSRGATMSECTLLTPTGQRIKTSSIWTLKRDVFGIPMMIIGNFLPILPQ